MNISVVSEYTNIEISWYSSVGDLSRLQHGKSYYDILRTLMKAHFYCDSSLSKLSENCVVFLSAEHVVCGHLANRLSRHMR